MSAGNPTIAVHLTEEEVQIASSSIRTVHYPNPTRPNPTRPPERVHGEMELAHGTLEKLGRALKALQERAAFVDTLSDEEIAVIRDLRRQSIDRGCTP